MRKNRLFLLLPIALSLGGCFGGGPQYARHSPAPQPAATAGYQVPVSTPGAMAQQAQSYPKVASSSGPKPRGFFAVNLGRPFLRAPAAAPVATVPAAPAPVYVSAAPAPVAARAPTSAPAYTGSVAMVAAAPIISAPAPWPRSMPPAAMTQAR